MRLVKNEPKVVKIALTRGNLLGLIAQYDTGMEPEASLSTLDDESGYLVQVVVEGGSALDGRRYVPTLPAYLQTVIDRCESCMEEAIMENGR